MIKKFSPEIPGLRGAMGSAAMMLGPAIPLPGNRPHSLDLPKRRGRVTRRIRTARKIRRFSVNTKTHPAKGGLKSRIYVEIEKRGPGDFWGVFSEGQSYLSQKNKGLKKMKIFREA
jgi:hypothetical protein